MSLPIGPSKPPTPPVAQFLAEAALQRQTQLLGLDKGGAAPAAPHDSPNPAAPVPLPTGAPAPAERVSISAEAREQSQPQLLAREAAGGAASGRASSLASGAAGPAAGRGVPAAPATGAAATPAPAVAPRAAPALGPSAWPTQGAAPAVQQLAQRVLSGLMAGSAPASVRAVQEWPAALARAVVAESLSGGEGRQGGAGMALAVWRVTQGEVQAADGARGMTVTLRVPAAALDALEQAARQGRLLDPGKPLIVPFEGRAAHLQSGALALVLQTPAGAGSPALRMSAVLEMDLQPWAAVAPQAMVYAREQLQPRLDPWLQMAALQASGQLPRDEEHAAAAAAPLCATPGCPYAGRAACEQPFCVVLRQIVAVVPPIPVGDHAGTGEPSKRS